MDQIWPKGHHLLSPSLLLSLAISSGYSNAWQIVGAQEIFVLIFGLS